MARTRGARSRTEEILDAAMRCFARKGFVGTTMDDVRRQSKASIGSIYHHFTNKEQLAVAIYIRHMVPFLERQWESLNGRRSPKASVAALISSYLRWVETNPDTARFLFYSAPGQEVRAVAMQETSDGADDPSKRIEDWFVATSRSGAIRKFPVEMYGAVVLGPVHSFAQRWLSGGSDVPIERAERLLSDSAWRAIKPS